MDVVFAIVKSKFVRPGPRNAFRGTVPYVLKAGLVAQAVQVGPPSPAVVKFPGLNQKLPVLPLKVCGIDGSNIVMPLPTRLALTKFPSPAPDGPGRVLRRLKPASASKVQPVRQVTIGYKLHPFTSHFSPD